MRKSFLLFSLMLICVGLFAQRKQRTEDYMNSAMDDMPFNMFGKKTYSYIVDEDGDHINDGAWSANCSANQTMGRGYDAVKIVGKSTITANFKKGDLHGPIKSTWNATLTQGSKSEKYSASMSGAFLNGLPHGIFTVNRKTTSKARLNANYKNGVLVGAFSCALLNDREWAEYSGTLTQTGKMNGPWKLGNNTAQFQNGILISESSKYHSTKPAIAELAKQYAAGKITKDQLMQKAVIVKRDSIKLGDHAFTAIYRDGGVNFKDLDGWYDFSASMWVYYESLEEVAMLSDKGFEVLKENQREYYTTGSIGSNKSPSYVYGAEKNLPYVNVKAENKDYYTPGYTTQSWNVAAYLSQEQYRELEVFIDSVKSTKIQTLKQSALTLKEHAMETSHELKSFLTGGKVSNWDDVKKAMKAIRDDAFESNWTLKPCPDDSLYLMVKDNHKLYPTYYVKKSSFEEFDEIYKNIDNEIRKSIEKSNVANAISVDKLAGEISGELPDFPNNKTPWKYAVKAMRAHKAFYEKSIKPHLHPYPSADNLLAYEFKANIEAFDGETLTRYVKTTSVKEFDQIDKKINQLIANNALEVDLFILKQSLVTEDIKALVQGNSASLDWRDEEKIMIALKEAFEQSVMPHLRPYPSSEECLVYKFDKGTEEIYLKISSVESFNKMDQTIEEFRLSNALTLGDFMVQTSFADEHAINYLAKRPFEKYSSVIKGLEKAYKNFQKLTLKPYPSETNAQAYIVEIEGVIYYVNKQSVDEFPAFIESVKEEKKNK